MAVTGQDGESKDGGYFTILKDTSRARGRQRKKTHSLGEANSPPECVLFPDVKVLNYSSVYPLRDLTKG